MKTEYTNTTENHQVIGNTSIVLAEGTKQACQEYLQGIAVKGACKDTLCIVAPHETISGKYGSCCGACDQRESYEDILAKLADK